MINGTSSNYWTLDLMVRIVLTLASVLFVISRADAQGLEPSLIHLIATPERYDGKRVMVTGYCNLEFEGNAIYLHADDYRYFHTKNGVWLNVSKKMMSDPKLRQTHCLVRGVFRAKDHGHLGLFAGALSDIDRYEPRRPREKP